MLNLRDRISDFTSPVVAGMALGVVGECLLTNGRIPIVTKFAESISNPADTATFTGMALGMFVIPALTIIGAGISVQSKKLGSKARAVSNVLGLALASTLLTMSGVELGMSQAQGDRYTNPLAHLSGKKPPNLKSYPESIFIP